MRIKIVSAVGLILGLGVLYQIPVLAETTKQIFSQKVVFQKLIDVQNVISNSKGKVVIDDNLKVNGTIQGAIYADDVLLGSPVGSSVSMQSVLDSDNLQDALDKELAIDIAALLPGTSWTITNTTTQTTYSETTGTITFVDADTLTIDEGRFAAAGLNHDSEFICAALSGEVSYQVFNNTLLYLSWSDVNGQSFDAIMPIFASNKSSMSLVGSGGCPSGMNDSISTLTKE